MSCSLCWVDAAAVGTGCARLPLCRSCYDLFVVMALQELLAADVLDAIEVSLARARAWARLRRVRDVAGVQVFRWA